MRQQRQGRQARWQERLAQVTPEQLDIAALAHHRLSGRRRTYPYCPYNPTLRHWVVNALRFEHFRSRHEGMPDHAFELAYYRNVKRPVIVPWIAPELYEQLPALTPGVATYVRF